MHLELITKGVSTSLKINYRKVTSKKTGIVMSNLTGYVILVHRDSKRTSERMGKIQEKN